MSKEFLLVALLFTVAATVARADKTIAWGVTGAGNTESRLVLFNPDNGQILNFFDASGFKGASGLAISPQDGKLYSGQESGDFVLLRWNKKTGVPTVVGTMGRPTSNLTFQFTTSELYGYSQETLALLLIDETDGFTFEDFPTISEQEKCGLSFTRSGKKLFLTETNTITEVDRFTGEKIGEPVLLQSDFTGLPTDNFDNILSVDKEGKIWGGLRGVGVDETLLYTVDPLTGLTHFECSLPASLNGLAFDVAKPPKFNIAGKTTIRSDKKRVKLSGTFDSLLRCSFTSRGESFLGFNGKWQVIVTLPSGTNKVRVRCEDELGQISTKTVTVIVK